MVLLLDLTTAMAMTLQTMGKGDGGFIAVNRLGDYSMQFNTGGMFRATQGSDCAAEISIW